MNHNAIGRGYETFGNATAETVDRDVGEDATSREWYRPAPAPARFRWSMRDNVNYQQTAALAILDDVAGEAKEYLRRFHRTGWNSWRKGVEEKPFAFVIPAGQGDRRRVAQLVDLLRAQRIEVGVAGGRARGRGGPLRGGQLRRPPRPAVSQLRRRPADPAGLSGRRAAPALRRRLVVPAPALRRAGRARGRRARAERRAHPGCGGRDGRGQRDRRGSRLPARRPRAGSAPRRAPPADAASASRSRKRRSPRRRENIAAGSWILPAQDGLAAAVRGDRLRARPRLRERGRGALRPTPRRAAGPDRRLRALGGHRLHRLDPLRARRRARSLRLPARRGPARGRPAPEGGRDRVRPRAARPGRADPRDRARGGADGVRGHAPSSRASASPRRPRTSPAAPASPACGASRRSCAPAASWPPSATARRWPSTAGWSATCARPAWTCARRAPTCAPASRAPATRSAYGYPAETVVFRSNYTVYDTPRRWNGDGLLHVLPRRPGRSRARGPRMGRRGTDRGQRRGHATRRPWPATPRSSSRRWARGASSPSTSTPSTAASTGRTIACSGTSSSTGRRSRRGRMAPVMPPSRRTCATMPLHRHLAAVDEAYRAFRREIEAFSMLARRRPRTDRGADHRGRARPVSHGGGEHLRRAGPEPDRRPERGFPRQRTPTAKRCRRPSRRQVGDALVEFALATEDPDGTSTSGITRTRTRRRDVRRRHRRPRRAIKVDSGGARAWPADRYLNLWVCSLGGGLLGYAQFPGGPAATDGVVILNTAFGTPGTVEAPFDLGRTATHEVGHWLNLLHIWGDDDLGCRGSDNVRRHPEPGRARTAAARTSRASRAGTVPTATCS